MHAMNEAQKQRRNRDTALVDMAKLCEAKVGLEDGWRVGHVVEILIFSFRGGGLRVGWLELLWSLVFCVIVVPTCIGTNLANRDWSCNNGGGEGEHEQWFDVKGIHHEFFWCAWFLHYLAFVALHFSLRKAILLYEDNVKNHKQDSLKQKERQAPSFWVFKVYPESVSGSSNSIPNRFLEHPWILFM